MKKLREVCVIIMCLAMQDLSASPMDRDWGWAKTHDKERFARDQKRFNDPAKLKEQFEKSFLISLYNEREMTSFTQAFGIKEEALRVLLMEIIREASAKTGWQWRMTSGESEDNQIASMQLREAISWLSVCADERTKQFLMDIAIDKTKHDIYRRRAAFTYLRCADAQEIRDALTRFFSDDMWAVVDPISGPYRAAMWEYDRAGDDTKKREAIVTIVSAALAKEENKNAFVFADKLLAGRSKDYAESPQRKAALQRLNIQVEDAER